MDFKKEDIKQYFTYNEWNKANRYIKERRVRKLEIENENGYSFVIDSIVQGTRKYKQHIVVKKINKTIDINGDCTCPVGYNCKHVATALIYYLNNLSINTNYNNSPIDNWLNRLNLNINPKLPSDYSKNEHFLTYRFFESDNEYSSNLKIYKSRYLKNGSINRGVHISSVNNLVFGYSYSDIIKKEDKEVLSLLRGIIDRYSISTIKIEKNIGYYILTNAIETKRAFYKDSNIPLSFSNKELDLKLIWQELDNSYKLKIDLDKRYHLIYTNPLLAIDKTENCVVKPNNSYNIEFLKQLKNMPEVPKENIADVFFKLYKNLNLNIPVPKEVKSKSINSKPIFKIILENHDKPIIKLKALYDEFELSLDNQETQTTLVDNQTIIEITRDKKAEQEAIKSLNDFEFNNYTLSNDILFYANKTREENLDIWEKFLNNIDSLEKSGWIVESSGFKLSFEDVDELNIESYEEDDGWFDLSFNLKVKNKEYPIAPLVASILENYNLNNLPPILKVEIEPNRYVKINSKEILPILKTIYELFDNINEDSLKVSRYEAHFFNIDENIIFKGNKELLELSKKLQNFKEIKKITPPKALNATLREYQQEGLNWLNFLNEFKFGGILADDMGLGKTLQTLSLLSYLKEQKKLNKPTLIIMPTSLIFNWKDEIEKFTPNLSYLVLYGKDREEKFKDIKNYDLILTSYNLAVRDLEILKKEHFEYIILDESQKIKNPKTKIAQGVKELKSNYKLALSGTPIENNLEELWSVFSFLMPGFLKDLKFFKAYYQKPIEKENSIKKMNLLKKKISPFILRRTKDLVAKDLPKRNEIIKYATFEPAQEKLYESVRVAMEKKVKEAISKKGLNRSHITILDALLKLRQVCCDSSLVSLKEAKRVKKSAKLELLIELLDKLLQEDRKILIFSQFTTMLEIIEEALEQKNIEYVKLTGSTTNREDVIKKFKQNSNIKIFLISLKAGGVGLNLTEADSVIHYDPWWNPAVENQATDRAHRIGQDKPVFVYKLIVKNTIEEKILQLQKKKKALQDSIYNSNNKDAKFDPNELLELLKI